MGRRAFGFGRVDQYDAETCIEDRIGSGRRQSRDIDAEVDERLVEMTEAEEAAQRLKWAAITRSIRETGSAKNFGQFL